MHVHGETLDVGRGLADELEFDREDAGESVQVGRLDGEERRPVRPVAFMMSAGRRARVRWVVSRTWRSIMSVSRGSCEEKAGYVDQDC